MGAECPCALRLKNLGIHDYSQDENKRICVQAILLFITDFIGLIKPRFYSILLPLSRELAFMRTFPSLMKTGYFFREE